MPFLSLTQQGQSTVGYIKQRPIQWPGLIVSSSTTALLMDPDRRDIAPLMPALLSHYFGSKFAINLSLKVPPYISVYKCIKQFHVSTEQ